MISTVNIQHLESLNDVVEQITGIRQRETVPDEMVRAADQIELVDMDPDALRRRMAHGNIYAADKVDAALGNYFRPGNLSALRELALLWVADRVDDELGDYRARHGITKPWETRERVIVALSGAPGADHLIRRAARIAQRAKGELIGAHVVSDSGLASGKAPADIAPQRHLLDELGGEYRKIAGSDIATALVELARSENATQIVLGASARSRWQELVNGSVINRVVRISGPIDVHVISRPADDEGLGRRLPAVRSLVTPLSPRRQLWGWVITLVGLPLMTLAFANLRETFGLSSVLLLYLLLAMVVALVGGVLPAAVAVLGGFLLANYYFTPPLYQFTIGDAENLLALVAYALAAGIVAVLVDRVGRSQMRAARARAEAEALASLAGALTRPGSIGEMLGELRATFGFETAALVRRDGSVWTVLASSGGMAPIDPEQRGVEPRGRGRHAGPRRWHAFDRRPAGARGVCRPGRCRRRDRTAAGRGRQGRRSGRRQHAASVAVAGRLTRPPNTAGVDQGLDLESASRRHRVASRDRPRVPGDDRVGNRPADRSRRQPARHEPAAGIGPDG